MIPGAHGLILSLGVAAAGVVLLFSAGPAAAQESPPAIAAACEHGQALEAAGRQAAAERVYVRALSDPAARPCALEALGRIRAGLHPSCAHGRALEDAGKLEDADRVYTQALGDPSSRACALTALLRMSAAAKERTETQKTEAEAKKKGAKQRARERSCRVAKALEDADRETDAESAYVEILKKRPGSPCATQGLERLDTLGEDAAEASKDVAAVLVLLGEGIVLASASALLLLMLFSWFPPLRRFLAHHRPFSWFLAPRLKIDPLAATSAKPAVGGGVTALVREAIPRSGRRRNLDLVSEHAGLAKELEGLADVSAQSKAVVALLGLVDVLTRRERFTAGGELLLSGKSGPGVSVSLQRGRSFGSSWTAWSGKLGIPAASGTEDPEPYYRLAVPAGAWIGHEVGAQLRITDPLTSDSRSYAHFRTAVDAHGRGEYESARAGYADALMRDPRNVGALNNLAILEAREDNFDEAVRLLEEAWQPLDSHLDPNWYRVGYNLAAQQTHAARTGQGDHGEALVTARKVALAAAETLERLRRRLFLRGSRRELAEFLEDTAELATVALVAGLLLQDGADG